MIVLTNQKTERKSASHVQTSAEKISGVPNTLTVKPIKLLHKIGRMTTPLFPDLMGLSTLGILALHLGK